MKLKPLGSRVLVKPNESEERTKGGIYIPDSAKEKKYQGDIVAVGPGKINDDGKRAEMDVKVGDTVMYKEYGGSEFEIDGQKYILMDADDILGIFE
ncbi:co-chaperone GroES [archaeon]|jgi:chaperonin GroES|nr:co-chaperone GroES [archaeon]MBT4647912.1 co-chaperone GroES [archaeon]MBT7393146.1 co-chaperone GroES [archaeon]